jgi:hypothetical protein
LPEDETEWATTIDEVARLVREGYLSGYEPRWDIAEKEVKIMAKDYLPKLANELAETALEKVLDRTDNEPLDGDETEKLARLFLKRLNYHMGNK